MKQLGKCQNFVAFSGALLQFSPILVSIQELPTPFVWKKGCVAHMEELFTEGQKKKREINLKLGNEWDGKNRIQNQEDVKPSQGQF